MSETKRVFPMPETIARIISVVVLGLVFTLAFNRMENSRIAMGKEAYVAREAQWFDNHYTRPRPLLRSAPELVIIAGVCFGVYELLAFGIGLVIRPRKPKKAEGET